MYSSERGRFFAFLFFPLFACLLCSQVLKSELAINLGSGERRTDFGRTDRQAYRQMDNFNLSRPSYSKLESYSMEMFFSLLLLLGLFFSFSIQDFNKRGSLQIETDMMFEERRRRSICRYSVRCKL